MRLSLPLDSSVDLDRGLDHYSDFMHLVLLGGEVSYENALSVGAFVTESAQRYRKCDARSY